MRTIGEIIKESRIKKKYSREKLEKETKIKREFIRSIEEERWDDLPEYPVIAGFIKNLAGVLDINPRNLLALLRRDYPPKVLRVNPKPDLFKKFTWSPKLTFLVGIIVVVIVISAYLGFQYINFIKPPEVSIILPEEGFIVTQSKVTVKGITNPEATVVVNNQPVIVQEDGSFTAEIEIYQGTQEIVITAKSRAGKETIVHRKIVPNL